MSPSLVASGLLGAALLAVGGFAAYLGVSLARFRAYYRHKGLDAPPLPVGALACYAVGEIGALLTITWWALSAARRDGLLRPDGPVTGPPVLCIHGIIQDGSNLWGIRRALARRGRASVAVSLGRYARSLDAHVPALVHALRALVRDAPDGRVDVVAHSMGGVLLRMALARAPELAPSVRRVVTLGSPHAGTASARGVPIGGRVRALGRRSEVLRALPGLPPTAAVTTIAARHDLVVYPQTTCHLPQANTIDLPDVGHAGLLTRPAVQALVVEAICEGEGGFPLPVAVDRRQAETGAGGSPLEPRRPLG